jgi:two-component system cell cycle sensor histidine kinase/response regulator CckA
MVRMLEMNTHNVSGEAGVGNGTLTGPPTKAILVVEDESAIRKLLVSLLSSQGYRTESVADGMLALRILEEGAEIDLVLTDLSMPGISGTSVAEYLAETRPEVKVVCMSGNPYPHEKILKRLLDGRLVDYLPKPFTPVQVLQMVRRCLER